MNTRDALVCWILALPAVAAFYFAYGVIEELLRKRRQPKLDLLKPLVSAQPAIEKTEGTDPAPQLHGYDTPELFRRDALLHIGRLDAEVAKHEQNIQNILSEIKKRERCA
jgi:hypothetical protein